MAISKALIASILISLLVMHLAEADQMVEFSNVARDSLPTKIGEFDLSSSISLIIFCYYCLIESYIYIVG